MRLAIIAAVVLSVGCAGPSAEELNARGKAALNRGDVRAATSAFASAVKASPETSRYRFNLALALTKAGAHQQAATELREAIRLDAANMDARRLLARLDTYNAPAY